MSSSPVGLLVHNKKGLVQNVFDQVYDKYDIMNDFMSLGAHRLWKRALINMMAPSPNKKLVDVACGTADIAKLYLKHTSESSEITCVDPNGGMIKKGKEKLNYFKTAITDRPKTTFNVGNVF